MSWMQAYVLTVFAAAWLLGYLAARARYLPAREAATRLHAIAREVLDSGIVKRDVK